MQNRQFQVHAVRVDGHGGKALDRSLRDQRVTVAVALQQRRDEYRAAPMLGPVVT